MCRLLRQANTLKCYRHTDRVYGAMIPTCQHVYAGDTIQMTEMGLILLFCSHMSCQTEQVRYNHQTHQTMQYAGLSNGLGTNIVHYDQDIQFHFCLRKFLKCHCKQVLITTQKCQHQGYGNTSIYTF